MPDLLTRLDVYSIGRAYVLQRATRIDPGQVDVVGSDVNLFVGSQSVVADTVVKQLGYSIARLTLDGAFNEDLDRLVYDRYGSELSRKGASPALGAAVFNRPSNAGGAGTILVGTKLTTLTGIEYITTSPANFTNTGLPSDLQTVANVRAVQAGKNTQIGANFLTRFSQPGQIFDRTISVNNPLTTAGGEDSETDDVLKNRVRTFWANARRGILSAIAQGATSVPGVVSAVPIEVLTPGGQPARVVNLYIADSSGVASAQLAQVVSTQLNDFRAGGIAVIINTTLPQIVTIQLLLSFQSATDTVTLSANVQAAVVSYVNSLPTNATLGLADLYSVLSRFRQDGLVVNVPGTIVAPTGDLIPAIGQTLRTTLANVVLLQPS